MASVISYTKMHCASEMHGMRDPQGAMETGDRGAVNAGLVLAVRSASGYQGRR
jgi:hypothetical protein